MLSFVVKAERIDTQGEREACSGTAANVRPGLGRQPKGFVPDSVSRLRSTDAEHGGAARIS